MNQTVNILLCQYLRIRDELSTILTEVTYAGGDDCVMPSGEPLWMQTTSILSNFNDMIVRAVTITVCLCEWEDYTSLLV